MDIQRLCDQRIVMEKARIFILFVGEYSSRCGVRFNPWYQGSIFIAEMYIIFENYTQHAPHCVVRGAVSSKVKTSCSERECASSH